MRERHDQTTGLHFRSPLLLLPFVTIIGSQAGPIRGRFAGFRAAAPSVAGAGAADRVADSGVFSAYRRSKVNVPTGRTAPSTWAGKPSMRVIGCGGLVAASGDR